MFPRPSKAWSKRCGLKVGDKVSQGHVIVELEQVAEQTVPAPVKETESVPLIGSASETSAQVVVIGAGPGGYTAAFRAAPTWGWTRCWVERYPTLGGVCLNVGCIPSKALLHTADVMMEVKAMASHGVSYGEPEVDIAKLGGWKDSIVQRLTKGLAGLAKQRKVRVIHGHGRFVSPMSSASEAMKVSRAFGSRTRSLPLDRKPPKSPCFPTATPRLMDSTDALVLEEIPHRLLIIGGGIIGLEMAAVYHALGSRITVVELLDDLIPGCDRDLVWPLQKRIEKLYENIFLGTKVVSIEPETDGLKASFEGEGAPSQEVFDRILVAVGRRPNGQYIGAEECRRSSR